MIKECDLLKQGVIVLAENQWLSFRECRGKEYYLETAEQEYQVARNYCRSLQAQLTTLRTPEEVTCLKEISEGCKPTTLT